MNEIIWLWIWLASILPAILIFAFVFGRAGMGQRFSGQAALVMGCAWPLMVPLLALCWLVERAVLVGEKSKPLEASHGSQEG